MSEITTRPARAETAPNTQLRNVRLALHLSQAEFAAAVNQAGAELGRENHCSKRLVQKWESGEHAYCRPHYQRALERATGIPFGALGFPHNKSEPHTASAPLPHPALYHAGPVYNGVAILRRIAALRKSLNLIQNSLAELQEALKSTHRPPTPATAPARLRGPGAPTTDHDPAPPRRTPVPSQAKNASSNPRRAGSGAGMSTGRR